MLILSSFWGLIVIKIALVSGMLLMAVLYQRPQLLASDTDELNPSYHLQQSTTIDFELKHVIHNNPGEFERIWDLQSNDLSIWDTNGINTQYSMNTEPYQIHRLSNRDPLIVENYIIHSLQYPHINTEDSLNWTLDDVLIPNITDPFTILQLAKMASNAYAKLPSDPSWRDVDNTTENLPGFNSDNKDYFDWDKGGVRGHIFIQKLKSEEKSNGIKPLIIIAIKGTTAAGLGGGNGDDQTGDDGKSVERDKINDNLLFSCCCGRVSSLWTTVCDCYEGTYTCNINCLERSLRQPDKYYKATLDIYRNVVKKYPDSDVWVTGHSLGGALSALLGRTYGLPVVTFEAPGDLLAAKRLHLPLPPGFPADLEHIWQFGNNADPIFMGVCNGASSSCSIAGYAMESICHSGRKCTYDTVNELGWHVNMLNHRLKTVIDSLLSKTNITAECIIPPPCLDCYDWTFKDHLGDKNKDKYLPSPSSSSIAPSPSDPPKKKKKCIKYTWYGSCYKWEGDDDDDDHHNDNKDDNEISESNGSTPSTLITKTTTHTKTKPTKATCIGYNRFGFCTEYSKIPPTQA